MDKRYLLQPENKMWKQGFLMKDENENVVYEAKVLKQSIFGSQTVDFVNHISNKSEQHKIGAVATTESSTNGMTNLFSVKSRFKIDGKIIWDHLHEQGVRIDSGKASGKLAMSYQVSLKGNPIATVSMSSPKGKSLIGIRYWLEVITSEENLDLAFLTAYAIIRTEQIFYH